jgi:hypothetical protein
MLGVPTPVLSASEKVCNAGGAATPASVAATTTAAATQAATTLVVSGASQASTSGSGAVVASTSKAQADHLVGPVGMGGLIGAAIVGALAWL